MERGIIIPALEKYEHLLIHNIQTLRDSIKCNLPIELWQIGQEVSDDAQDFLKSKQVEWNLSFKNVYDYTDDPGHWQGYQIKAFIMKHTTFDEVILFDCDSVFLQDPTIIFDDPKYIETGTFFFKDYLRHTPNSKEEELERIKWFQRMMPFPSPYLPKECYYLYDLPIQTQQYWFYQESGMVYLNRKRHPKVVDTIYQLNHNHQETYKYVHGDKETFWIACLLCNVPFHTNNYPGINLYPDIELPMTYDKTPVGPSLVHIYIKGVDTLMFYSQKAYPDTTKITKEDIAKQLE
jgi:hypothetical protein